MWLERDSRVGKANKIDTCKARVQQARERETKRERELFAHVYAQTKVRLVSPALRHNHMRAQGHVACAQVPDQARVYAKARA